MTRETVKVERIPGPPVTYIDEIVTEKLVEKEVYKEKIYEKIILLQEVHQVATTIHEIAEVRSPGSGIEIETVRQVQFNLDHILTELRRNDGVPHNMVLKIEQYLKQL